MNVFRYCVEKGIAQSDLYQMVSYAFKRGCTDVILIYPNISEEINPPDKFELDSGFGVKDKITITAIEIPFSSLSDFSGLESTLIEVLENCLNSILNESSMPKH